ncbi:MAG: DNA polymerase III subunit delta' [Deltaproteobacteria bacterium]|nr:DNA polymerase III subunit delta' [Deltaproteobacteria bacterium]MBW2595096.1 DNA polymerase III subunit delta' [Deltaproteobacteria bacterium]MBW2649456.1 DNA polymerase III subunit delta' [Deltaproteobacteria bacterium]
MPFSDIYGQGKQLNVLQGAMKSDRVPHAYLFHGIKGVGKKTTAKTLAKALNCGEENADSCDRCHSCLKIDRGIHPDIVFIEPEGIFIKINKIRELQDQIKFRPFEGRKRVFVITDADRMNDASANALLKTLEEPKPSNILILTTSRVHKLPQTIISRCQKIRFNPVRSETITSFLTDRLSMDEKPALTIASSSGGSIGRALEIKKESFFDFKNDVIKTFSAAGQSQRVGIQLFFLADSFGKDRESALQKLDIFRGWHRDMLVYRETRDVNKLIHRDIADATKKLSEKMAGTDILENIKAISDAYDAIDRNANRQLILESMAFRLNGLS